MAFGWDDFAVMAFSSIVSGAAGQSGAGAAERSAQEQLEFAQKMYQDYKQKYGPIEGLMLKDLGRSVQDQPGVQRALALTRREGADLRGNLARSYASRFPAGSNMLDASLMTQRMGEIDKRADILTTGDQQRTTNILNALSVGKGMPASAQNLASVYDQRLGYAAQNAGSTANAGASMAQNIPMLYMLMKN